MKTKVLLFIAVRIIFLFTTAMLLTFIPEHLVDFFNDQHDSNGILHPSARHKWFDIMMLFLFILALVDFAVAVVNVVRKNYDL